MLPASQAVVVVSYSLASLRCQERFQQKNNDENVTLPVNVWPFKLLLHISIFCDPSTNNYISLLVWHCNVEIKWHVDASQALTLTDADAEKKSVEDICGLFSQHCQLLHCPSTACCYTVPNGLLSYRISWEVSAVHILPFLLLSHSLTLQLSPEDHPPPPLPPPPPPYLNWFSERHV